MNNRDTISAFNNEHAPTYDSQRKKLAALKDALHLCIRLEFSKLPIDARILCVGAGTGAELNYLAGAFPNFQFTVVEPAPAMLKICRQKASDNGITNRCTFHEGYLDSLPDSGSFDAATSILVSHFIFDENDRTQYFRNIATRLRPSGYMINADLSTEVTSEHYESRLDTWINMHNYADIQIDAESFGRRVALLPTEKMESIITNAGFESSALFFQTFFIHAWVSKMRS